MILNTGKFWLCLACMLGTLCAGDFVPPADGPVPFRRDRLPLRTDAMKTLSEDLWALARENQKMDAPGLRAASQMLALALALNPENENARRLVSKYKEGRDPPAGNDGQKNHHQVRIRRHIEWLETPQAGADGRALAACLKDILLFIDSPDGAHKSNDLGVWTGWVSDLSAFQSKVVEEPPQPKDPDPIAKQPETNGILLEAADILAPMWRRIRRDDSETWVSVLAPLQMTAKKEAPSENAGFSIIIGNPQDWQPPDALGKTLETLLRNHHGSIPTIGRIQITNQDLEQSAELGKPQSISAAAAVLASAAVTGRAPEAIVIGKIDAAGTFTLPSQFWDRLRALGKGNGQRLILPTDASPYLSSFLAMEKPEFFIEYEVLLAENFKQLLEFSAKSPQEPLATTTAKFREIRERAANQDLRTFIGNIYVKQRLAAVLQDQPAHASAKMLLTQATGNRPIWVSRNVLAAEIRQALEPMAWIKDSAYFHFNSDEEPPPFPREIPEVSQTFETCRPAVDRLERYTSRDNLDLLAEARELVFAIRTLYKAPRIRSSNSWESISNVRNARNEMIRRQENLAAKLDKEAK